jgi:hypothetical protein
MFRLAGARRTRPAGDPFARRRPPAPLRHGANVIFPWPRRRGRERMGVHGAFHGSADRATDLREDCDFLQSFPFAKIAKTTRATRPILFSKAAAPC